MYCKYCGKELSNDSNYCPNCGKKQKKLSDNKSYITSFISTHKRLLWIYFVWVLVHVALYLSSSPLKTYSDGFYPFDVPIRNVLNGERYYLSIIDNVDVYDVSELFFYTTLFPLIILGLVKCKPFILRFLNKIKDRHKRKKEVDIKKKEATVYTQNKILDINVLTTIDTGQDNINEKMNKTEDTFSLDSNIEPQQDVTDEDEKVEPMPLTKRFIGSIIDKILLITILTVGSIALNPFGAPSKLGGYVGILNASPNNYEYIDQALINSYGTYYEGVSKGYQDLERLANDPPHIGTVMELDISITFTFIFLNLIYYFLFESILSASLGKRMAGGILLDYADEKISITKAFVRSLYSGILMVGSVYVLHFLLGLSYYIVIALFFLLMDGPILFTKKSLLDLCTNTRYIKRKWN